MNHAIENYYQKQEEGFYDVILLNNSSLSFEEASSKGAPFPKGWYELCHIDPSYKIEFMCDFWLKKLPFHPHYHKKITEIFSLFDDIFLYLVKESKEAPFRAHLVYSLKQHASFFRGYAPASQEEIRDLKNTFEVLPRDFLSFFEVHNGFARFQDLGLMPVSYVAPFYEQFQTSLRDQEKMVARGSINIDPSLLIPFYETYGLNSYQCFYADWYPSNEMGNVYFSGIEDTISDYTDLSTRQEMGAYESFSEWLICYLQGIESKTV